MTPPQSEEDAYRRSVVRIGWFILAIGVAGALAMGLSRGFRDGAGFLAGASVSGVSFWRWRKVAESLGGEGRAGGALRWTLRFALVGAAAYVMIQFLSVSVISILLGLLAAAAAVVVEIVFQLIHART